MAFMTMEPEAMEDTRLGTLRVALGAVVLWGIAALGAHLAQQGFHEPIAQFAGRLVVIALCGQLLGRLGTTITEGRSLVIGLAWAALAIGTEMYLTTHGVHGWYELLGSPVTNSEWMRGMTVVAWLVAPRLATRE